MGFLSYHLLSRILPASRDFLDMGYGISARKKRCKAHWSKHLTFSKQFQADSLCEQNFGTAILGSGRLYDVSLRALFNRTDRISLYDADPSAILYAATVGLPWMLRRKLSLHCAELTGSLAEWSHLLDKFLKNYSKEKGIKLLPQFLSDLKPQQFSLSNYDAVISLNLLSQIPLYWRDRVLERLKSQWDIEPDAQDEITRALNENMQSLQAAHLRLVSTSAKKTAIILSDSHFYYYQKDKAPWLVEDALLIDPPKVMPNDFTLRSTESWLWHIAPQDIEQNDYGVIHRVQAWCFHRDSPTS